ncbi:hypothetical protein [Ramlibacter montanisoli]|uniref:hypothetical protein n=1 Tax=Ramlibacter montanisoli TaxID=2732512 RepID=UPI0028155D9B|nr:hypothetical protein [Ramlibacter montanisoli]
MKNPPRTIALAAVAIALLAGAGYGLYRLGLQQGQHGNEHAAAPLPATPAAATSDPSTWTASQGEEATRRHIRDGIRAGSVDPVTGRKVLYYQDPMSPARASRRPASRPS